MTSTTTDHAPPGRPAHPDPTAADATTEPQGTATVASDEKLGSVETEIVAPQVATTIDPTMSFILQVYLLADDTDDRPDQMVTVYDQKGRRTSLVVIEGLAAGPLQARLRESLHGNRNQPSPTDVPSVDEASKKMMLLMRCFPAKALFGPKMPDLPKELASVLLKKANGLLFPTTFTDIELFLSALKLSDADRKQAVAGLAQNAALKV